MIFMKKKILLFAILSLFLMNSQAQQPFSGCWQLNFLKDWTPQKDVDAKFNRSTVKLQDRFQDNTIKANNYQFYDGQVAACLTMNPSCSQTPSQDARNFIGYNPTYWQYLDLLIWWGGSAGEGIIMPPSAPVIDITHINGVKVLGQVFFPTRTHGGAPEWVQEFLSIENGKYLYAQKLYEIAEYYGFDGWFINQETETSGTTPAQWKDFMDSFLSIARSNGHPEMEMQWYDGSTSIGSYEDMVKLPGVSYMLNYGSATSSNISSQTSILKKGGISDTDIFKKLYFGAEIAQSGLSSTNAAAFQALYPQNGHAGSIDLFNPEEVNWKKVVENLLNNGSGFGYVAYTAMENVFRNEDRFWTNLANDPSDVSARNSYDSWPGLANAIMERSVIQSKPFVTTFGTGQGKGFYINGAKLRTVDWYHRGMQTIMPTWRWWIDCPSGNKKDLTVKINWDDVYNIGSSLSISGKLVANTNYLMRLYKTHILAANGDKFQLIYKKNGNEKLELKVGISENANSFTTFPIDETSKVNGWSVAEVDLSSLNNKTISIIALNIRSESGTSNFSLSLGQLGIIPQNYAPAIAPVKNLKTEKPLTQFGGDLRLTWDAENFENIHHFNIYIDKDGNKTLEGQTRSEGFYIPNIMRTAITGNSVRAYIVTVSKEMKEVAEAYIDIPLPEQTAPEITIKVNKTLAEIGSEITAEAKAEGYSLKYNWTTPEGATLVRTIGNKAIFKFDKEGFYDITVAVTNNIGTSTKTEQKLVQITANADLEVVSVGKTIDSHSGSIINEHPGYIVDGEVPSGTANIHNKWCFGGREHWVIIDLEQSYKLQAFKIFDCGNLEDKSGNISNYKIYLSKDKVDWKLVVDEKNRYEDNTKEDYIRPQVARYVKFEIYDSKPITIRIWEFEALAIPNDGPKIEIPENIEMNLKDTQLVNIPISLGNYNKENNFNIEVIPSGNTVKTEINEINETSVKVNLTATAVGESDITIHLTNGDWECTETFKVRVNDPSLRNLLLWEEADTYEGSQLSHTGLLTDNNKTTAWKPGYSTAEYDRSAIVNVWDTYEFHQFGLTFSGNYLPNEVKLYVGDGDTFEEVYTLNDVKNENIVYLPKPAIGSCVKAAVNIKRYAKLEFCEFEAYGKEYDSSSTDKIEEKNTEITVFPNPVFKGDNLKIQCTGYNDISLYSALGTLITKKKITQNIETLPTSGYAPGTYILVATGNKGSKTLKVIIQ